MSGWYPQALRSTGTISRRTSRRTAGRYGAIGMAGSRRARSGAGVGARRLLGRDRLQRGPGVHRRREPGDRRRLQDHLLELLERESGLERRTQVHRQLRGTAGRDQRGHRGDLAFAQRESRTPVHLAVRDLDDQLAQVSQRLDGRERPIAVHPAERVAPAVERGLLGHGPSSVWVGPDVIASSLVFDRPRRGLSRCGSDADRGRSSDEGPASGLAVGSRDRSRADRRRSLDRRGRSRREHDPCVVHRLVPERGPPGAHPRGALPRGRVRRSGRRRHRQVHDVVRHARRQRPARLRDEHRRHARPTRQEPGQGVCHRAQAHLRGDRLVLLRRGREVERGGPSRPTGVSGRLLHRSGPERGPAAGIEPGVGRDHAGQRSRILADPRLAPGGRRRWTLGSTGSGPGDIIRGMETGSAPRMRSGLGYALVLTGAVLFVVSCFLPYNGFLVPSGRTTSLYRQLTYGLDGGSLGAVLFLFGGVAPVAGVAIAALARGERRPLEPALLVGAAAAWSLTWLGVLLRYGAFAGVSLEVGFWLQAASIGVAIVGTVLVATGGSGVHERGAPAPEDVGTSTEATRGP